MGAQVVVPDSKLVEPLLVQFPALAAETLQEAEGCLEGAEEAENRLVIRLYSAGCAEALDDIQ